MSGFTVTPTYVETLTTGPGGDIYVLSNRTLASGRHSLKCRPRFNIVLSDKENLMSDEPITTDDEVTPEPAGRATSLVDSTFR